MKGLGCHADTGKAFPCPLSDPGCHGSELKLVKDQGQKERRKLLKKKKQDQVRLRLLQRWTEELRLCVGGALVCIEWKDEHSGGKEGAEFN